MRETIYKEISLKDGHVLQILYDTWAESPRSWGNLGTMAIFHNKYNFGDDVAFSANDFNNWKEMEEYITDTLKAVVCLPIYMYDHSGITINTTGFACPWDSGQVGFIYVTDDKMKENYGDTYYLPDIEKAKKVLLSEVKTMDQYIRGDVYAFRLLKEGEELDRCSGFFGNDIETNGILDYIPEDLLIDNL